jgi:hypothetical protein
MGIIFFILIAGAWAAFLLPSFLDSRRDDPSESTHEYAISKARLGALAGSDEPLADEYYAARASQVRRQRVFLTLLAAALSTLVLAVMLSSYLWLSISIMFDVLIGTYVAVLLYLRQQAAVQRGTVVPLDPQLPEAPTEAEDLDFDVAAPTVRIIGG